MDEINEKAHYIAVTGIIRSSEGKYLICKRSMSEKLFPGKWCVPGGKIQQSDFINSQKDTKDHWFSVFEKVLKKEIREETGIEIKNINYVSNLALIRPNGFSTFIVSLNAEHESGEVKLQKEELSDFAWVEFKDLKNYDLIENIYEQIEKVNSAYNKPKKIGVGVGVMILNHKGEILLGLRNVDPAKADSELHLEGTWTMPGGKLNYGELFIDGAKREVKEETNIDLIDAEVICINEDKNEHAHFITIGMLCRDFSGEAKVMEPDEITEWKWFDLHNLPKPLYFPSEKILKNYFEKKFYISKN